MNINPSEIHLTDEQKEQLAHLANEAGMPWEVVFNEMLSHAAISLRSTLRDEHLSAYDELKKSGAIGCLEGPEDLSTNKKYMDGFGKSANQDLD